MQGKPVEKSEAGDSLKTKKYERLLASKYMHMEHFYIVQILIVSVLVLMFRKIIGGIIRKEEKKC